MNYAISLKCLKTTNKQKKSIKKSQIALKCINNRAYKCVHGVRTDYASFI